MSDQILIECLRAQAEQQNLIARTAMQTAADRIEALVKERDFILSNQTYSYLGKNLKRWLARDLEDAKDAAEAKLNKAVEALREIYEVTVDQKQIDMHVRGWVEVYTRSVLAELEGME